MLGCVTTKSRRTGFMRHPRVGAAVSAGAQFSAGKDEKDERRPATSPFRYTLLGGPSTDRHHQHRGQRKL
jgi:hypothetical protein